MAQLTHQPNRLQTFLQFIPKSKWGSWLFARTLHYFDRPVLRLSHGWRGTRTLLAARGRCLFRLRTVQRARQPAQDWRILADTAGQIKRATSGEMARL
jgi:hypothetical protein